jgi:hypothetical protein
VLTGRSAEEIRRGQATAEAAAHRAAVIERVFLCDGDKSFAELLLVFEMANAPTFEK